MMKEGVCVFLVAALVLVNGLPQGSRRKLSRQEVTAVAGDVVQSSLTPEIGSLPPLGDIIDNKPTTTSTVRTIIEGEVLSTPFPSDDGKAPSPVVVIPGVNVTGMTLEPQPAPFPTRVTTTQAPPPTTTVKPDEEDSSSEEEEEELGGPQNFGEEEADDDNDDDTAEEEDEEEEEDDEARKEVVVHAVPVPVAVPTVAVAAVAPSVKTVSPKRVNSKARDEPFSLEISTDANAFQDGPPGGQKYDAFIPGYMTEAGEIFVPIDTTDLRGDYSIVEDPGMRAFSPKKSKKTTVVPKRSERKQIAQKVLYDDDDDDADDDEDTETSSQEDDDDDEESVPVRVSSFNIIYKKKTKKKPENDDDDSEEKVTEVEEGAPDSVEPEAVQPKGPTASVVTDSSGDKVIAPVNSGLFINAAQGIKSQGGENVRPPSLAYVPASLPTGEDDENEFTRMLSQRLLPVYETVEDDASYEYLPRTDFLPYFVPEKAHRRSFRNYYVPNFSPYNYMLH